MRRWLPWALGVGLLVLLLVVAEEAWARVGGGQGSSRGIGGSRGGGGGGDGVPIELVILLVRLVIEYPAIGVPLVAVVVGFLVARSLFFQQRGSGLVVERTRHAPAETVIRSGSIVGLASLRDRDPGFSLPVLLDYVVLVHRRALEAIGNRGWEPLAPFVSEPARDRILQQNEGVATISEVVTGGVRVLKAEQRSGLDHLVVRFESTRLERTAQGEQRVLVDEIWTFRRRGDAKSLPPERMAALDCPSCGAPIEVGPMGQCTNCGTPITKGQLQWQVGWIDVRSKKPATIPEPTQLPGGVESSVHVQTVLAPDLASSIRRLQARRPEFDGKTFESRVDLVYHRLQDAWSRGKWSDARPFVTDRMYQTLRFWIEGYARAGLANRLEDVALERVRIVKVDTDAYYEAITVRLWGSMKDSVVDRSGKVIGGNAAVDRKFSEYWTFLRSADGPADTKGEAARCPSCGAPLDRVDETGVCGYCEAKITSGRFDWVLARIEQPEAYGG